MKHALVLTVLSMVFFSPPAHSEDIRFELANGGSTVVDVAGTVEVVVLEQGVKFKVLAP